MGFSAEGSGGGVIDTRLDPPVLTVLPQPWAVDESFQFGETNFSVINDIELFPDGWIAYGGAGRFETVGRADRNGGVINSDSAGWTVSNVTSLTIDADDRVIYSVGLPGGSIQRSTTWDDFNWSGQSAVRGAPSKVYRLEERALLVAGSLTVTGDTNRYGLVRLDLAGKVDESFAYTNLIDLDVKSAVVLADGSVIATYLRTNGNLIWSEARRWLRDGTLDASYNGSWAETFGTNSQVTAIAKAPGTNGFVAAIRTEPVSGGGSFFSRIVTFDEAGNWRTGIPPAPGDYIEGTVNAIAFEVVNPATTTNGGYDRILVGGEFARSGTNDCNNLASFELDGSVAWCFPTNFGPNTPIGDVAVQLDGRILIAGAFTNVNGMAAKGLARIYGNSPPSVYWADTEFRGFEGGLLSHGTPITMRRSGNVQEPLTVFLTCEHPQEGELVNVPSRIDFAPGEIEASSPVGFFNNAQVAPRERFEIIASVTNANVIVTRAKTDFVLLDDETPGALDSWYDIPYQLGRNAFGIQADGKIIFGGPGTNLERYNPDGTIDRTFVTNGIPMINSPGTFGISEILPQHDGTTYVAGLFNTTNGPGINHVARLNADGTLDTRFNPRLGNLATRNYVRMLPLKNRDVLIWVVTGAQPQMSFEGIFRLNDRGERIRAYQDTRPWSNEPIWALTDAEELFTYGTPSFRILTKHTAAGTTALNFPFLSIANVRTMEASGDWLLLAGNFTNIASVAVTNIARLNVQTGAVDTNFPTVVNGAVYLIREHEGKLYISGDFTEVNGRPRSRLARLSLDGSLDESFDPGLGPNRAPQQLQVQIDGSLMIGTAFDRVDGVNTEPFVRIRGNAAPGEIRFVSRRIELSETNQFVAIEVERVGGSAGALSTTLSTVEGSARAGQQFVATNVTVIFADGEFGRKTVQIPVIADAAATGAKTFSVLLGNGFNAVEATVLISDEQFSRIGGTVSVLPRGTNAVRDIAVGVDGLVYVGGSFTNIGGVGITNFARLTPELTPDASFALEELPRPPGFNPQVPNPYAPVEAVAVRPDGRILFGGNFTAIGTNTNRRHIAQASAAGIIDSSFSESNRVTTGVTVPIGELVLQPDEKVIANTGQGWRRLNANGTRDPSFGPFGSGSLTIVHGDGTIFAAQPAFSDGLVYRLTPNNQQSQTILRVAHRTASGLTQQAGVRALAIDREGALLVGGDFTHLNVTNHFPRLARVFTNGVVDTNFVAEIGVSGLTPRDIVTAIHVLRSGDILVGGKFGLVQGVEQRVLAVLSPTGKLRRYFDVEVVGNGIAEFEGTPDGGVVVSGAVATVDDVPVGEIFKLNFEAPQPPVAKFLWLTNGQEVLVSDVPNEIRMHVFDPDGYLERVVLELDGQPIATNSTGNVPFYTFLPESGEHQLRVTATDASGLSSTETVTFRTTTVVMQPSVIVQSSAGDVVITYQAARLQESSDLVNWTDAHTGGGEFRPSATESHRFFRAAGP